MNGRLPNQDVVNSVAHIARWAGGVHTRLHDIDDTPMEYGPSWIRGTVGKYLLGAKYLLHHIVYAGLGSASGAHGVLARYAPFLTSELH